MPTPNLPILIAAPGHDRRAERLIGELRSALRGVHRRQVVDWAADAARVTGHVFVRRGMRLGKVVGKAASFTVDEARRGLEAARRGRLGVHSGERRDALVRATRDTSKRLRVRAIELRAMVKDPAQLPEAVVCVVAALVSSGGIDANGGAPDLDLQFGIGAHRSILTHSIIAGSVIEGSLYSVATLVGLTYAHLPKAHDPLWDTIDRNRDRFLSAVAKGAGAGVAYHLLIDGTLQPGAYHDLPVSMPLWGHEAVLDANAAAEALDVTAKSDTFRKVRYQTR